MCVHVCVGAHVHRNTWVGAVHTRQGRGGWEPEAALLSAAFPCLKCELDRAVIKKGSGAQRHLSCALKEERSLDKCRGWETGQYLDFSSVFIVDISHVRTRREDSVFKNPPTFHPASTLVNVSLVYFENREGFRGESSENNIS